MAPDPKTAEKRLDRDFLGFFSLTKNLYNKLESESDKKVCEAWLNELCGKSIKTLSGKRDRNIYLSRLVLQMQEGKLKDVFQQNPPADKLESPYKVFGLPTEVEDIKGFNEMGFQLDADTVDGDVSEASRDGRTYLATRQIANGMMAYLAVTVTEDEPVWFPQQARSARSEADVASEAPSGPAGRFVKRLAQFECVPLTQLRKAPEDRLRVLEWMDRIIDGCNKWLKGEDPHNMDLETLFKLLYQDYQDDPEKANLLQYPKDLWDILIRDIRKRLTARRAEVSKRELILDQYEADEYLEERVPGEELDAVWLQCAKRPMSDFIKKNLDNNYPPLVVERFFELLVQERISIIERGERDAKKKIAEMRSSSVDDIKKELHKLKKLQQEYKEYYCIYKEAEECEADYHNFLKESSSGKGEKALKKQDIMKLKGELEEQIEGYKRRYEKERKAQGELVEKLEEAKEALSSVRERLKTAEERMKCEKEALLVDNQKLKEMISTQKKRICELKGQVKMKQQGDKKCD